MLSTYHKNNLAKYHVLHIILTKANSCSPDLPSTTNIGTFLYSENLTCALVTELTSTTSYGKPK